MQNYLGPRSFYLALYKQMSFLEKRGCPRTALEYCKLILRCVYMPVSISTHPPWCASLQVSTPTLDPLLALVHCPLRLVFPLLL